MEKVQQAVNEMFKGKSIFPVTSQTGGNKRGELYELKNELNADTKDKRKDAVKKVIAQMTVGRDVSMLFADVVKNMQTDDLELKKLVYLYLINYAKSQPELVILAVNTFVKDSDDFNPLIRALAIRTMACLRVQKILDYICEPLRKALQDNHPYVRKTAVIGVAKLFDLSPQLAQDNGFIAILQDLLSDPNPMVVANSVSALLEIMSNSENSFIFNTQILNKLLAALNECTEWGQTSILDALATHQPTDNREADMIIEKVIPRLQHINSSVVLAAVKVLVVYLEHSSPSMHEQINRKLATSLVSLLTSTPPEIQYVALRNTSLILQKYPNLLQDEVRVFFCKYNDPLYVKLEKLQLMVKLANDKNIDQVVSELKEYANEVDIEFVRKSVACLGECAISIETAAERCVNVLLDLVKNKVSHVVQEAVVVIKDIFRKYPNRFEAVIPVLCESLDLLEEPDAKASIVWIIGENSHRIENAAELLEYFLETFKTDSVQVQLQFLTAAVKLFLRKPQNGQELVQKLLKSTSETAESADLRDKAFFYWRLLSADPQAAKAVVLAEKPPIQEEGKVEYLLQELIKSIGSIASVYHKPASTFLPLTGANSIQAAFANVNNGSNDEDEADDGENINVVGAEAGVGDLLDLDFGVTPTSSTITPSSFYSPSTGQQNNTFGSGQAGGLIDLLSGSPPKPPSTTSTTFGQANANNNLQSSMNFSSSNTTTGNATNFQNTNQNIKTNNNNNNQDNFFF